MHRAVDFNCATAASMPCDSSREIHRRVADRPNPQIQTDGALQQPEAAASRIHRKQLHCKRTMQWDTAKLRLCCHAELQSLQAKQRHKKFALSSHSTPQSSNSQYERRSVGRMWPTVLKPRFLPASPAHTCSCDGNACHCRVPCCRCCKDDLRCCWPDQRAMPCLRPAACRNALMASSHGCKSLRIVYYMSLPQGAGIRASSVGASPWNGTE